MFVDLFTKYPLERADAESIPGSCRHVSFAGHYAEEIVRDLEELGPSLVVYDTFAVIGRVVGGALGVPHVNVCAGHTTDPARAAARIRSEYPRVVVSPSCLRAVETLRERYGIPDASPFSHISGLSPFLNVYCEPAVWLSEEERRLFEPVAFYGSLPPSEQLEAEGLSGPSCFGGVGAEFNVYVSLGTVVWRYWPAEALAAIDSISRALGSMDNVRALLSLGEANVAAESAQALSKPNVSVASSVDQWRVLQEADVFVTHHGLSSTHEAIFHQVPMISYPFFADQPLLAEMCRSWGLAIPLTDVPHGPVTVQDVRAAFAELVASRESMRARLAEARVWEVQVVADRDTVHRRIAGLVGQGACSVA